MELRRQLAFVRSSLPLIIATTVIALIVSLAVSLALPPTYEATVLLNVGQSVTSGGANDYNSLLVSQRLSQTYAVLAVRDSSAQKVIDELGLQTTTEALLSEVHAEAAFDSTLLTITVSDEDPVQAAAIANAFALELITTPASTADPYEETRAFIEKDMAALRKQIDAIEAQIAVLSAIPDPTPAQVAQLDALQLQSATLRSTYATMATLSTTPPANQVTIANPATVPVAPVSPRVLLNVALGALLGLVLGVGLAYTRHRLDDTLRTPEEVETVTGLPSLGTIVQMPGDNKRPLFYRLATLLYPRSPAAEGFRHVRTSIEFASGDTPVKSLLVTSAMPGDGKTTFAANLAVSFAQAGRKVCLVDADLRKPELHNMLQLQNQVGLSDLLHSKELTFDSATQATEVEGLRVLTSGPRPDNPAELVASSSMRAVLNGLLKHVDIVILDSPPIQAVTDAALLGSLVDGTIIVAASGKTRRAAIVRARDTLQRVGARVLGTALNGVSERDGKDAALGYFSYYGVAEDVDGTDEPPTASSGGSKSGRDQAVRTTVLPGTASPER